MMFTNALLSSLRRKSKFRTRRFSKRISRRRSSVTISTTSSYESGLTTESSKFSLIKVTHQDEDNVQIQLLSSKRSAGRSANDDHEFAPPLRRQSAGGEPAERPQCSCQTGKPIPGGYRNLYRSTFGPTVDETLLVGMETLCDLCSCNQSMCVNSVYPEDGSMETIPLRTRREPSGNRQATQRTSKDKEAFAPHMSDHSQDDESTNDTSIREYKDHTSDQIPSSESTNDTSAPEYKEPVSNHSPYKQLSNGSSNRDYKKPVSNQSPYSQSPNGSSIRDYKKPASNQSPYSHSPNGSSIREYKRPLSDHSQDYQSTKNTSIREYKSYFSDDEEVELKHVNERESSGKSEISKHNPEETMRRIKMKQLRLDSGERLDNLLNEMASNENMSTARKITNKYRSYFTKAWKTIPIYSLLKNNSTYGSFTKVSDVTTSSSRMTKPPQIQQYQIYPVQQQTTIPASTLLQLAQAENAIEVIHEQKSKKSSSVTVKLDPGMVKDYKMAPVPRSIPSLKVTESRCVGTNTVGRCPVPDWRLKQRYPTASFKQVQTSTQTYSVLKTQLDPKKSLKGRGVYQYFDLQQPCCHCKCEEDNAADSENDDDDDDDSTSSTGSEGTTYLSVSLSETDSRASNKRHNNVVSRVNKVLKRLGSPVVFSTGQTFLPSFPVKRASRKKRSYPRLCRNLQCYQISNVSFKENKKTRNSGTESKEESTNSSSTNSDSKPVIQLTNSVQPASSKLRTISDTNVSTSSLSADDYVEQIDDEVSRLIAERADSSTQSIVDSRFASSRPDPNKIPNYCSLEPKLKKATFGTVRSNSQVKRSKRSTSDTAMSNSEVRDSTVGSTRKNSTRKNSSFGGSKQDTIGSKRKISTVGSSVEDTTGSKKKNSPERHRDRSSGGSKKTKSPRDRSDKANFDSSKTKSSRGRSERATFDSPRSKSPQDRSDRATYGSSRTNSPHRRKEPSSSDSSRSDSLEESVSLVNKKMGTENKRDGVSIVVEKTTKKHVIVTTKQDYSIPLNNCKCSSDFRTIIEGERRRRGSNTNFDINKEQYCGRKSCSAIKLAEPGTVIPLPGIESPEKAIVNSVECQISVDLKQISTQTETEPEPEKVTTLWTEANKEGRKSHCGSAHCFVKKRSSLSYHTPELLKGSKSEVNSLVERERIKRSKSSLSKNSIVDAIHSADAMSRAAVNKRRATAPRETRYAITRVMRYDDFTAYEVLKSTRARPKVMPCSTEGVFIVRNKDGKKV